MPPDEERPVRVATVAPALSMRLGLAAMLDKDGRIVITASAAALHDLDFTPENLDVLIIAGITASLSVIDDFFTSLPNDLALPAVLLLLDAPPDLSQLSDPFSQVIRGFLSVESSTEKLTEAVAGLAAGLFVIEPDWVTRIAQPLFSNYALEIRPSADLSAREIEVLQHLAFGLANKQISALLSLSENTIKYHISSIYSKLGASNRAEAVRLGARQGYINL